ncbi:MAG TPA: hypothetical protein VIM34_11315 [Burkholderiaceae bacterium]
MPSPEQIARLQIDAMLTAAGWAVQDYAAYDPGAARGIALCEVPLRSGRCDYLLLHDRQPLGVIEAKRAGTLLVGVAEQSAHYAVHLPAFFKVSASEIGAVPLPPLAERHPIVTEAGRRQPRPRAAAAPVHPAGRVFDREPDAYRIISAWKANKPQRAQYEKGRR